MLEDRLAEKIETLVEPWALINQPKAKIFASRLPFGTAFYEDVRRMLNRQKAIQDKQLWLVAGGLATGLVGLAFWVAVKK